MTRQVDIKLGYSCNNNCIHCVIADQRNNVFNSKKRIDRTTEEYKSELSDSRERGFETVIITGGEPTIRRDIFEISSYAHKLGYDIQMQTNGRMFHNPDFAKRFVRYGIRFTIALHGSNSKVHDHITQTIDSFKQTVQGIRNLRKLNQIVAGKVVISKLNYKDLNNILKLFKLLKVDYINFAFPHALGNARMNFDGVVPKYTELEPYIQRLVKLSREIGIKIDFEAFPYCFMKGIEELISEKRIAKEIELKQFGMETQMWSERRRFNKAKFSQCKKCKYDHECEGPWKEYAEWFGDGEFRAIS
jgi:MoaA/NifB/PqqE/SkfB family radical SAM enzyme